MDMKILSCLWVTFVYLYPQQALGTDYSKEVIIDMLKDRKGSSASSLIGTETVRSKIECAVLCATTDGCVAANIKFESQNVTCELLSHSCGVTVQTGWTLIKQAGGRLELMAYQTYFNT